VRGREIKISFLWFFLGPAAILLPYVLGSMTARFGLTFPESNLAMGGILFFVFFRLWAYYHVVRQHWGFFALYKRKANDYGDALNRVDYWFFNLSLYLPLVMFMTSAFYAQTPGFPDLGLRTPQVGNWSIGALVYPLAWTVYLAAHTAPIEVSLTLLEALHQRWVAFLTSLSEKDFARTFKHPEMGIVSLDKNLSLYAWHGRHHVAHITSLRERMGWV